MELSLTPFPLNIGPCPYLAAPSLIPKSSGFPWAVTEQGFPSALKVAEPRARHYRPPLFSAESSSPHQPITLSSGRACVALDRVPLPGNSVWGPNMKLRHLCPASLGATCLILSHQLHRGRPGCLPGLPSQPSFWKMSGLTGGRPHSTSL